MTSTLNDNSIEDEDARTINKLVLDMARMLNGRSVLEIDRILQEVRKLVSITTVMDTTSAEFKGQEELFNFHFGKRPEHSN